MAHDFSDEDVKFLFNALRQASVTWSGRSEILRLSRKKVLEGRTKKGKPIYKLHWQCAKCFQWFRSEKELEVDHIVEIGGVSGFTGDWTETIKKIFPRPVKDHLQVCCIQCHQRKTLAYNSAASRYVRKKNVRESADTGEC